VEVAERMRGDGPVRDVEFEGGGAVLGIDIEMEDLHGKKLAIRLEPDVYGSTSAAASPA
jgi:hypothetical protein